MKNTQELELILLDEIESCTRDRLFENDYVLVVKQIRQELLKTKEFIDLTRQKCINLGAATTESRGALEREEVKAFQGIRRIYLQETAKLTEEGIRFMLMSEPQDRHMIEQQEEKSRVQWLP